MQALDALDQAVALDCETNGTGKDSEVIELAIVSVQTKEVLFDSLIQPTDLTITSEKVQAIHQIPREELEKAPTFPDVWPLLCSLLVSHPLVAYNDKFDIPMIRRSALKWGIQAPRLYSTCAMKLFSAYQETDDWYTLDEACTLMAIDRTPFGDAHRALADTPATVALLDAMRHS
jgi:DNA polymerase III epsilon subunit-like protein